MGVVVSEKCISTFYVDFKDMHDRMVRSLLHFHPDVTLKVAALTPKDVKKMRRMGWGYPIIELPLFDRYSTVTHIDADVIVVDRIDELWDDSTDVRAGRNNTDNNRCCNIPGVSLPTVDWRTYVNSGIHSISSRGFIEEWMSLTYEHADEYKFHENDTFNVLFHSENYKPKLLDPIGSKVCWGTSINEGTKNFWETWKELRVAGNDHLEFRGRRMKVLHLAGGLAVRPAIKSLVTKDVLEYIEEITR